MMIRGLDIILSSILLLMTSPIILIALVTSWIETRHPLFVQERIGQDLKRFNIYKIRTMHIGTVEQATHLVDSERTVPRLGKWMRRWKIDELPQLVNVILGDMSLVGPRPNLPNQTELIALRIKDNIYSRRPGITGIAQIQKIDMSNPERLVEQDFIMINQWSTCMYIKVLAFTLMGRGLASDGV